MNPNISKEIVPEIPPSVQNRMARGTALTQDAADEIGADEVCVPVAEGGVGEAAAAAARNSGPTRIRLRHQQEQFDARQIDALNDLAKAPPGFEPAAGMPAADVMKIMGMHYPGEPTQDPTFGDRTPEYVVFMFEQHPVHAHIRYLSRMMPDVGRWIAKHHPKFVYKPNPIRVALPGTTMQGFLHETTVPPIDPPEIAALKARIAELEKAAHPLVSVSPPKRKYTRKPKPTA